MRVPSNLRQGDVGFNMTPMIDVVFLLIIFFLVSSHLARQENQLQLPLPTAETGQQLEPSDTPRVTVNVLSDGTLLLGARQIAVDRLETALRERLAQAGPALQVRIRAARDVPYVSVAPVMRACAEAGIWDVSYAVYRKRDVP